MPCDILTVNDTKYTVLRLLGKGKGGYSYLVTDGRAQYVLKQIHHEPCDYYTFGDKLQSELRDYKTLRPSRSCSKRGSRIPAGSRRCRPCARICTRRG